MTPKEAKSPPNKNTDDGTVVAAGGDAASATVNGIGFWKNLTRNFKTPLLGFLDLLDNAVDAVEGGNGADDDDSDGSATTPSNQRVSYIAIDNSERQSADKNDDNDNAGISLINTCAKEIPALDHILELFSSQKGETALIGENGIGLKQGCACLSDLSFICTKSNHEIFQLGIIAKRLQTEKQIRLPSLVFSSAATIHEELVAWLDANPDIQQAVQDYGDNADLQDAINRLHDNLIRLQNDKTFSHYPHVFALFLHQVKHGNTSNSNHRSDALLDEIAVDLPHRYLHIPKSVVMTVRGEPVKFSYWQSRLVELAEFKLYVSPTIPLHQDPNWNMGLTFGNTFDSGNIDGTVADDFGADQNIFRLYIGFDALRVADKNQDKLPNLYVYSRASGRKIVKYKDARNAINMTGSGGTMFCQGLTILLDDCENSLPLNPTKQDTAFAERRTGAVFQKNLYSWISAAVRTYYNRFFETLFLKKKASLTEALMALVPAIKVFDPDTLTKSMAESQYSSFGNFARSVMGDTIRLVNNASNQYTPGPDVLFRLHGIEPHEAEFSSPRKKRKAAEAEKNSPQRSVLAGLVHPLAAISSQHQQIQEGTTMIDTNDLRKLKKKAIKYVDMKNKKNQEILALTAQVASLQQHRPEPAVISNSDSADGAPNNCTCCSTTNTDHQLIIAELREQLAEQQEKHEAAIENARLRVKELKRATQEQEAKNAEVIQLLQAQWEQQSLQYRLQLQDKDNEIICLKTQAEYFKAKRDELLAQRGDDDDDDDDSDDE